jgi:hypothetical protein
VTPVIWSIKQALDTVSKTPRQHRSDTAMNAIMTTVTDYEDKALELIVKVQDEILGYVKQAVQLVDERLPELDMPEIGLLEQVPTLEEVVTTQFAFSKKLLTNQEKFAKNVVKAVKPLTRDAKPKAKAKTAPKAA